MKSISQAPATSTEAKGNLSFTPLADLVQPAGSPSRHSRLTTLPLAYDRTAYWTHTRTEVQFMILPSEVNRVGTTASIDLILLANIVTLSAHFHRSFLLPDFL
ncbi:hypothetical protein E2C01_082295 [Portunus trituberculatus]|uniref:Uncharacterized protein n=1 Tax=Portunus trituberculatus TaxID=210409 RepID=A0A5B7IYU2_PORTR|nr:hypothetical protein [Portunus trituberculatus]